MSANGDGSVWWFSRIYFLSFLSSFIHFLQHYAGAVRWQDAGSVVRHYAGVLERSGTGLGTQEKDRTSPYWRFPFLLLLHCPLVATSVHELY